MGYDLKSKWKWNELVILSSGFGSLTNLILQVVLQCVVTFIELNCDWHVRHNIMTVLTSDLLHKRIILEPQCSDFLTERDVAFLFCCVKPAGQTVSLMDIQIRRGINRNSSIWRLKIVLYQYNITLNLIPSEDCRFYV